MFAWGLLPLFTSAIFAIICFAQPPKVLSVSHWGAGHLNSDDLNHARIIPKMVPRRPLQA